MTDLRSETRFSLFGIAGTALFLLLLTADLIDDWEEGVAVDHVLIEGGMFSVAAAGIVLFALRFRELRRDRLELRRQLVSSREEADRWRAETADLLAGLSAAIDRQFDRWQLTPAEREVALLLLRGASHRQIAGIRGASERTVRQQAHLLYRKGGFSSRADLAAFFLEDLLKPRGLIGPAGPDN